MDRKKILLATSSVSHTGGGIASYNEELFNAYSDKFDFSLLSDNEESEFRGYRDIVSTFGKNIYDTDYCILILDYINNSGFDLVINSRSSVIPFLAPFIKVPIISVAHFYNGIQAYNAAFNHQYLFRIITLSNYSKDILANKFKIKDKRKICTIYNFVHSSNVMLRNKDKDHVVKIVYPGGTSIQKSSEVIVDLVYKLLSTDIEFKFYWLGGSILPCSSLSMGGPKQLIDLFPKDQRLIITGKISREDSQKIIGASNIFLLPSRGEGCPMTLLEAMREGCIPIISDAKHGSLELINKLGCGFVAKQGDSNDLFCKISHVISNHSENSFIYSKTYKFSREYLSLEIWKQSMDIVIDQALCSQKNYLNFSKNELKKNINQWKCLVRIDRIKSIMSSLFFRIKINCIYFRWRR